MQMLLNAQGCSHTEPQDVHTSDRASLSRERISSVDDEEERSDGDVEGGAVLRLAATGGDGSEVEERGLDEGHAGQPGVLSSTTVTTRRPTVRCRCRQAMRLLARLVRGLPAEAPAVVLRQAGLASIVQILEHASRAAVDMAAGEDGGRLAATTEAAAGEALEVCCARMYSPVEADLAYQWHLVLFS